MSTYTTTKNLWRNDDIPVEISGRIYHGTNRHDDPTEVLDLTVRVTEDVPVWDEHDCPVPGAVRFRKGETLDLEEDEERECEEALLTAAK